MPTTVTGRLHTVPAAVVLTELRRGGPLGVIRRLGEASQGAVTRLGLGPFRPLFVSHPEHLRHILREHTGNYPRGAAMWSALGRLTGNGIAGEGPGWLASRNILRASLSSGYLHDSGEEMITAITAALQDLARRAENGPVEASTEMSRIVHRVINPLFFGSRIPQPQCDELGAAITTAMNSLLWRMAMPFVPHAVPLPGDRAFIRATATANRILLPVIHRARQGRRDGRDLMTALLDGTDPSGAPLNDAHISQDIVALFLAGSESSAVTLTWALVALARYPDVAARVREEADRVLGEGPPRPEHIRQLVHTQRVLAEVTRLYSVGWAVPRTAVADDVVDGVFVPAGSTVVISPYLTHRLAEFWPRPARFDPGRFTRQRSRDRHPLAHVPFGSGPHQCVGQAFFLHEAALVLALILRRFELGLRSPAVPRLTLTLTPRGPVVLTLTPRKP
ncbi:cytochrome P450 [Streptomyces sp. YIM 98790]|uniref:cytochrome P450 n=1 Tax=Streptomyces sp. YIM 98790 TaxID=2689077 RepID=UPI00140C5CD4|nr:cytochrome P450 [Streptomyces sp. YIM 98790]